MGELKVGDIVFDEAGKQCRVLYCSPIMVNHSCYEVIFSDESKIIADEEHLWPTYTYLERASILRRTEEFRARRRATRPTRGTGKKPWLVKLNQEKEHIYLPPPKPIPRTTLEISKTLKTTGKKDAFNHSIDTCGPLETNPINLPVNPYVLGVWLGNGTTCSGSVAQNDLQVIEEIKKEGFEVKKWKADYMWNIVGLYSILNRHGIRNNKHIPEIYFRASLRRLDLLHGLMDTNGSCGEDGGCEFTNTNKRIIDGVSEILHSLGIKHTVNQHRAHLNGVDMGPYWRIQFLSSIPMFRLKRKLDRQKLSGFRGNHSRRYIVSVKKVPSVPVRCIGVDSPSHCYLAGKSMIPTHNTFSLLFEATRDINNPGYGAVIFRKTYPEITDEGGLWDESEKIYPYLGAIPRKSDLTWTFPSGATISFSHLQHQRLEEHRGQYAYIGIDEVTEFTEREVFFLRGRNRSTCGVKPRMRLTCNPDPDHFLIKGKDGWGTGLMAWWINPETGLPILKRSGVIRYFCREGDRIVWVPKEWRDVDGLPPVSITFIHASVDDNKILLEKNPNYKATLRSMDRVTKERFLDGNWKSSYSGGMFNADDFTIIDRTLVPADMTCCRYWDRACTEVTEKNPDPDWTAGAMGGISSDNLYIIDIDTFRDTPAVNESRIRRAAEIDGKYVQIGL